MLFGFDPQAVRFDEPQYLWLLLLPAVLLLLWLRLAVKRRGDAHRFSQRRTLPVRERFQCFGGLLFWLCLLLASVTTILALAQPQVRIAFVRTAGIDLVVLQDGSTSMRVADMEGNRWQRSVRFLRLLGESLSWKDDRMALALFAHIAAPQIRLTTDPNTYFFFIDHLGEQSPFRVEDDTSWDTNMELGVYWGIRLVEKDEEVHGKSPNAKAFVLLSDGQAWSGAVQESLAVAKARGIPVYAIGVGTSAGGYIPDAPPDPDAFPPRKAQPPVFSTLDRSSLGAIATAGGGRYYELDRETDREIANEIIDATRSRASFRGVDESAQSFYWQMLLLSGALVCLGALFLQERAELALQFLGAAIVLFVVSSLIG